MRILVTGSEGSLMQWVIPHLLKAGHSVLGVDNFVRYGEIERDRNYDFVRGDLTDHDFVDQIMKGVDGVIQAAALIYGVGGFHKYPADILSKDIVLHQNILWAMKKYSVGKIAYISSSMVYERCDTHPSREEDVDDSLIPSTDYGLGSGEQIRCFTWIDDVASAIAKFSFDKKTRNQIYNLGNPEPVTMKDLARLIYRGDNELSFKTVKSFDDDVMIRIPSIEKAEKKLGFRPTKKVAESVELCVKHTLEIENG